MKKALVIFLALAMVCSAFAAEPVAEVNVADFTGSAALTFGIDLDKNETGFKNETSAELKLNLLKGGDKATAGDGVWGELKIKTGGASVTSGAPASLALTASVEKAVINFGPVYMGIREGDFDFGGDFIFPNALNYNDKKDKYVKNPTDELGYNQGFVLGYTHDMFNVELGFRSKPQNPKALDKVEVVALKKDDKIKKNEYYDSFEHAVAGGDTGDIFGMSALVSATDDDDVKKLNADKAAYKRVMKDDKTFWTNKYAVGLYAEVKPIKDLRIGVGGAYVLGDLSADMSKDDNNKDKKNDISVFAAAEYLFDIADSFRIQPVVAYKMYSDYVWETDKKGAYKPFETNKLGMGLRFGFKKAKSSGGSSLLGSFFEKDLAYNNDEKADGTLLPGVSIYSEMDLNQPDKSIPLFAAFYPGELVKGLNAAAFVHAKVGSDMGKGAVTAVNKDAVDGLLKGKDLQVGAAASYDVKAGDITIVPAFGVLFTNGVKAGNNQKMSAYSVAMEAKVDVKGLVDNTTFTLAWDESKVTNGKSDIGNPYSAFNKGKVTLKAAIAF